MDTLLRCHYDITPYRDALHRRSSGCCLFLLAITVCLLLDVITTFAPIDMKPAAKDTYDDVLFDPFVLQLVDIFKTDRESMLEHIKQIYPDGLEIDIAPRRRHRITVNQPYPVCFATPEFLVPFLSSELWRQTGVELDKKCFARIDPIPSRILEQMDEENEIAVNDRQPSICAQLAKTVMKDSFFVIDPERGVLYMLMFDKSREDFTGCDFLNLDLRAVQLNKLEFDEMLNIESREYGEYIVETNAYCKAVLLGLIGVAFVGRAVYTAAAQLLEALAATLIVWSITSILNCFGAFTAMNRRWRSPTLTEVWRVQLLLCVPELSVRLLNLSHLDNLWRIITRVMAALILLFDAYQNEPLQI